MRERPPGPNGLPVVGSGFHYARDPHWWDDPDAFDPARLTDDRSRDRPTFAYFPFGAAPRACIARNFATTEATLVLATLADRYRLERTNDDPLDRRASITMHPADPVEMTVRER